MILVTRNHNVIVCYIDINGCLAGNGGCEQNCTNLEGISSTTGLGYQCGCDDGYQLSPNNHDCSGTCVRVYVRKQSLWGQSKSAKDYLHLYTVS